MDPENSEFLSPVTKYRYLKVPAISKGSTWDQYSTKYEVLLSAGFEKRASSYPQIFKDSYVPYPLTELFGPFHGTCVDWSVSAIWSKPQLRKHVLRHDPVTRESS